MRQQAHEAIDGDGDRIGIVDDQGREIFSDILGLLLARWICPQNPGRAVVIDVKSTITETAEEVAARIRKLLEYVPAERLGVTTDCGLTMLQRYITKGKLHALVAGTQLVRNEIEAARNK
mgnify:CR=1 FL=1